MHAAGLHRHDPRWLLRRLWDGRTEAGLGANECSCAATELTGCTAELVCNAAEFLCYTAEPADGVAVGRLDVIAALHLVAVTRKPPKSSRRRPRRGGAGTGPGSVRSGDGESDGPREPALLCAL